MAGCGTPGQLRSSRVVPTSAGCHPASLGSLLDPRRKGAVLLGCLQDSPCLWFGDLVSVIN